MMRLDTVAYFVPPPAPGFVPTASLQLCAPNSWTIGYNSLHLDGNRRLAFASKTPAKGDGQPKKPGIPGLGGRIASPVMPPFDVPKPLEIHPPKYNPKTAVPPVLAENLSAGEIHWHPPQSSPVGSPGGWA